MLLLRKEISWSGWPPTVAATVALVGVSKAQAQELLLRLPEHLLAVMGKPGRPSSSHPTEISMAPVLVAVLDYVMLHAGAVCGAGERRVYSDDFRRFIVGLTAPGQPGEEMSTADLAFATRVPLGTLKDWLRAPQTQSRDLPLDDVPDEMVEESTEPTSSPVPVADQPAASTVSAAQLSATIRGTHFQMIATLWPQWAGPFQVFCQMLRAEHRIPHGDTLIGNLLSSAGLRHRKRQTPVEAPWSSNTYRTLFPGAQWLGDGTTIAVRWGNQIFVFNVEAFLDSGSNALMGVNISDSEDEDAVRLTYAAGLETADGFPPLALTLDNRPSNHSPSTVETLDGTTILRATPGRGQAKAALEGAFGLFQQAMPPLVIDGQTEREMAREVLRLVMIAWSRGRNGKPRKRLKGASPAHAYLNTHPTPEELQEALTYIRELERRQELARQTREARRDPVRIELLSRGLVEFGILDPERRLAIALAYYSRDAIVRGLATFRTKLDQGTVPPDADHGRYLGGIIRHLHIRLELEQTSIHLLRQRLRLNDLTLAPLTRAADKIRADVPGASELPQAFVDRALAEICTVDFRFWAQAAAGALSALPTSQRASLYPSLCRRIAASFKTDRERRADLIDRLAEEVALAA